MRNSQSGGRRPVGLLAALLAVVLGGFMVQPALAETVFNQPPDPNGGQYKSAWYAEDGLDSDEYVWDSFIIPANTPITEVRWRGAYTNYLSGVGKAPVYNFTVAIYASNITGFEPDVTKPPLVEYETGGNAGETPAGTFGGVAMYDYAFTLPSPFQATGGTKYWMQIEAWQGLTPTYGWPPDWSIAKGTGGNGAHFRKVGGTGGMFHSISGDCAFMLLTTGGPTWTINASASPANSGVIQGAGVYPANSTVTLTATANSGWGFQNWTENGSQVSTNWRYIFTATRDRTLVANFVPAYTIATSHWPVYGGTQTPSGVYNSGSQVTVTATPREGFVFTNWTDWGNPVSTSAVYTFTASADRNLVANFEPGPQTVPFDMDSGDPPPQAGFTMTPFSTTKSGLTADFFSPDGNFSLQTDGTWLHQEQLDANFLYPSSAFRATLLVKFSRPVTAASLDFATVEMESWADTPSPMVLRAFMDSTSNPVIGTAQSAGVYAATTYPEGVLVFTSAEPFNLIELKVGTNPYGTGTFMADNVSAVIADLPCPADFDGTGFVDTDDFDAFVAAFEAGTDNADFDGTGFVDTDDYDAFVRAFELGC
ncbi:MAG: hypothetical protein AMXMBFR58_10750 [Phycisphaerae bacterium]